MDVELLRGMDTFITTTKPRGCGIATRQLFQACMTPYILYCQVDQYLTRPFTESVFANCLRALEDPTTFYVDLAGNQGQGRPSERALLMRRKDYLAIPGIDNVIGGPGKYSDHRWTEQHLQEHMTANGLRFATANPVFFADNGGESKRTNPDGSEWMHYTDTKQLWLLKGPVKERFVYPKFSDAEWASVLETQQWEAGKIPEQEVATSFHVWH
jgi:hypothetical protein